MVQPRRLAALVTAIALPVLVTAFAPPAFTTAPSARSAAPSPQPPVATPPRPGQVYLSGENPVIFLFDQPGGTPETTVSFWRIHWSPVGPGHVCYVTSGREKTPGALRIALYDNERLFEYLTKEVLGTFNPAYRTRPFTPVGGATFGPGGDSVRVRLETCRSDAFDIRLEWRDLRPGGLVDILPGSRPSNPFGITYLRIPVGAAGVTINGSAAKGVSVPDESFLAFGETWIQ
jgi:hypothetical protein